MNPDMTSNMMSLDVSVSPRGEKEKKYTTKNLILIMTMAYFVTDLLPWTILFSPNFYFHVSMNHYLTNLCA